MSKQEYFHWDWMWYEASLIFFMYYSNQPMLIFPSQFIVTWINVQSNSTKPAALCQVTFFFPHQVSNTHTLSYAFATRIKTVNTNCNQFTFYLIRIFPGSSRSGTCSKSIGRIDFFSKYCNSIYWWMYQVTLAPASLWCNRLS